MKALILNSGVGKRMGNLTSKKPKCMTKINHTDTILSLQLKQLSNIGINDVIITTGPFEKKLIEYCESLKLPINYIFVHNPLYKETNYIYSIYLAKNYLNDDIISMHGDLVSESSVLEMIIKQENSSMVVSSTLPLPKEDFKAVVVNGSVKKIGVEFFANALAAQPLYYLKQNDWVVWLNEIIDFVETNKVTLYAENAFNNVADKCHIFAFDILNRLCMEVDTPEDLLRLKEIIK